jgi:hypothetical protein
MVDSVGFVENNPEILYIDLVLSLHTIYVIKTSDFMGPMATPPWGCAIFNVNVKLTAITTRMNMDKWFNLNLGKRQHTNFKEVDCRKTKLFFKK